MFGAPVSRRRVVRKHKKSSSEELLSSWAPARRADDEIRTRDIHLGKVVLYQLSYVRTC